MSTTTSNGYKKPEIDDTGDTWFPNLEDNIDRVNSHDHDGANSELLTPTTQTISSGSWTDIGNDTYSQVIDVTDANANFTYDAIGIQFRLSNGDLVYPVVEKTTATTYTVFTNDSSQTYTAVYTH